VVARRRRYRCHLAAVKQTYQNRDLIIMGMGYANYEEYLNSEFWANIRARTFAMAKGLCKFCNKHADHIHHSSYDIKTLKGDNQDHLHACCGMCHHKIEYFCNGDKTYIKTSLSRLWHKGKALPTVYDNGGIYNPRA